MDRGGDGARRNKPCHALIMHDFIVSRCASTMQDTIRLQRCFCSDAGQGVECGRPECPLTPSCGHSTARYYRLMSALDVELLLATVAAFWIGGKRSSGRALLSWSIGFALVAWVVRCPLIVVVPSDAAVSEDYLNRLTIWNASGEVALFVLWALAWSSLGMVLARWRPKNADVR